MTIAPYPSITDDKLKICNSVVISKGCMYTVYKAYWDNTVLNNKVTHLLMLLNVCNLYNLSSLQHLSHPHSHTTRLKLNHLNNSFLTSGLLHSPLQNIA